ncbi:prepilin-type N-terminal cleavage/methylation domain-containing protein [Desulfogranum japonicum]|uniref:prepilin-type N-terminal cleavage/methylation domain-containing protein n=1 Tax=Desulfogranum japonicum TaxID=231447 RepID=UPI00041B743D|nr:prepilin-type N-terminal cleavage/methylation domain-containing protein [Desulfogranum japonicum]
MTGSNSNTPVAFSSVYATVKGDQAFTLVELIVVIVVLSITVFFVMPQLGYVVPTGSVQKAARQLSAYFSQASRLAQKQSRPFTIHYTPSSHTFTLEPTGLEWRADVDEELTLPQLTLKQDVVVKDVQLYNGGIFSTGTFSLHIDKHGYLQPALVHLQDGSGSELTLQIEPFLGASNIMKGYVSLSEELFY